MSLGYQSFYYMFVLLTNKALWNKNYLTQGLIFPFMKKIIIIILYTLFFAHNTAAQSTAIPDPVFENKLIQLGIDSDGLVNGQMLTSDAIGVTRLDLNANSVTGTLQSLKGVEAFVDLISINCINHNLEDTLNLSANTLLDTIYCSQNNLTSINISTCTNLKELECYDNSLSQLDVSNCVLLTVLVCQNNLLTTIDISNSPNIMGLSCFGNNLTSVNVSGCTNLQGLDCSNNSLGYLDLTSNLILGSLEAENNLSYLNICVLDTVAANANGSWNTDPTARYTQNCFPRVVLGNVFVDDNLNCLIDATEKGLSGQFVKFERLSDGIISYFTTADTFGNYTAYLDTGTYRVEVVPNSVYWDGCPSSQLITITTGGAIQRVDWLLQPLVFCPILEVDLSAPFLRRTGGGSNYTVNYCNQGTVNATNATVDIDIDPDLRVVSTSIPIVSQVGTIYTFNLGLVAVATCGSFEINVIVDSTARMGQAHCTEAHIYPDTICVPLWAGPIIDGEVDCQNDSVFFTLRNIGAAMSLPVSYTIIEDNIVMRTAPITLTAGQTVVIAEDALPGKTYRINVPQAIGYPRFLGNKVFSKAIEGCTPLASGGFNTGFINQFSNGYSSPFKAIDCQPNVAAYDPNDKSAQPEGYDAAHYIDLDIPIDYKIRFQNTGTDTAFNVVILDTLSPYLDITSLQMGASSFPYNWSIIDGNVLEVRFPDIMLVDSNANEPLSHGFFRYRIDQFSNNPIDSIIYNQAAIYFDYNPPIFTNTTFHTIGIPDYFLAFSDQITYEKNIEVQVFPNPFRDQTTIRVLGKDYPHLDLLIFDVWGRLMRQKSSSTDNEVQFYRQDLPAGVYFYRLQSEGEWLNSGKLIIQ